MLNTCLILLANLASSPATPIIDIVPTIDDKGHFEIYLKATKQAYVSASYSEGEDNLRCDEERLDDGWSSFAVALPTEEKPTWVGPIHVYMYFDNDPLMLEDERYTLFFECGRFGCSEIDQTIWEVGIGVATIEKNEDGTQSFVREAIQLSDEEIRDDK